MSPLLFLTLTQADLSKHIYPLAPAQAAPAVVIDTTDFPAGAAWAQEAKKVFNSWWPVVTTLLATENFQSPKTIRLVFRKKQDAPAWAAGDQISISGEWITAHPDDLGMVVHELTHLVQKYPGNPADTGWMVEGIADYIRWWRYEPEAPRPRIDPTKNKYTDAYRTTASWLAWTSRKYNMGLVPALDRDLKKGVDPKATFEKLTGGKSYQETWDEFVKG